MKTSFLPSLDYTKNADILYSWLGSFWTNIFENPDLVQSLQTANSLFIAQLYLDYIESLNLRNRNDVPVFHRERWAPIVIKKSQANSGQANILKIDHNTNLVIGEQVSKLYPSNTVLSIGGYISDMRYISYPVSGIADIVTCIVDNPLVPKIVLTKDIDFKVQDNTIVFNIDKNPFDAMFPKRTILDLTGEPIDEEIVLWASDVLYDKDYVYNYIGYVLNIKTPSLELYKKILNALWDLHNYGSVLSLFKTMIGALFNEPTIQSPVEQVVDIIYRDTCTQVITDKNVYKISKSAKLLSNVAIGNTLHYGDFLSDAIRIYTNINKPISNLDLQNDVRSLFFDVNMFRAKLKFGIGADWNLTPIICEGLDKNNNPKLYFKLYGNNSDILAFWSDFWQYLEQHNISSVMCFNEYVYNNFVPARGNICGYIMPLEYFFNTLIKTNTVIIVIDSSKLFINLNREYIPKCISSLIRTIPAGIRLVFIENLSLNNEVYEDIIEHNSVKTCYTKNISDTANTSIDNKTFIYTDATPQKMWIASCRK